MTALARTTRHALAALPPAPSPRFDPSTIDQLPPPARRLLAAAIPAGAPLSQRVELEMTGRIKLGVWLPFTARQLLVAGRGLVWEPVVGGRIVRFVGADSLGPDGARMQFRLHDRIKVVDASGPDVDRSAAGRLAAETVAWLPQALTPQAGAEWRPIDDRRAVVILGGPYGPIEVDVTVDDDGALTELRLQRWNSSAKPPGPEPFGGEVMSTFETGGVRIAGTGTVGWKFGTPDQDDGIFFHYTITGARFGA
ncbi:MAG: DUF6544 family protein [Acidimicrobiales bacterium]